MMSNSVPEREKETLTGCVSFYAQWIDICVCIRVRGLHLIFLQTMYIYIYTYFWLTPLAVTVDDDGY